MECLHNLSSFPEGWVDATRNLNVFFAGRITQFLYVDRSDNILAQASVSNRNRSEVEAGVRNEYVGGQTRKGVVQADGAAPRLFDTYDYDTSSAMNARRSHQLQR